MFASCPHRAAQHTRLHSNAPQRHPPHTYTHTSSPLTTAAVTPGHYLFAWQGAGAGEAAAAALLSPAAWPYVLPTALRLGDVVPVVPPGAAEAVIAAGAAGGQRQQQRPVLARVTAVEEVVEQGVFMPHTLAGACRAVACVEALPAHWWEGSDVCVPAP